MHCHVKSKQSAKPALPLVVGRSVVPVVEHSVEAVRVAGHLEVDVDQEAERALVVLAEAAAVADQVVVADAGVECCTVKTLMLAVAASQLDRLTTSS